MNIRFEIDELILNGFDARDRRAIADALQSELVMALADFPAEPPPDRLHVDAGAFAAPPGSSPAHIGRAIAWQLRKAVA